MMTLVDQIGSSLTMQPNHVLMLTIFYQNLVLDEQI